MDDYEKYLAEKMKDAEFRKEWEALQPEDEKTPIPPASPPLVYNTGKRRKTSGACRNLAYSRPASRIYRARRPSMRSQRRKKS